jgi:hypothetical protein
MTVKPLFILQNTVLYQMLSRSAKLEAVSVPISHGLVFFSLSFFSFGATAPIWALAYLHETLRFTPALSH